MTNVANRSKPDAAYGRDFAHNESRPDIESNIEYYSAEGYAEAQSTTYTDGGESTKGILVSVDIEQNSSRSTN